MTEPDVLPPLGTAPADLPAEIIPGQRVTHADRVYGWRRKKGAIVKAFDTWIDVERIDEIVGFIDPSGSGGTPIKQGSYQKANWYLDWANNLDSQTQLPSETTSRVWDVKLLVNPDDTVDDGQGNPQINPSPNVWILLPIIREMTVRWPDDQIRTYQFLNDVTNVSRQETSQRIYGGPDPSKGFSDGEGIIDVQVADQAYTDTQRDETDQRAWTVLDSEYLEDTLPPDTALKGSPGPDGEPPIDPPYRMDPFQNIINVSWEVPGLVVGGSIPSGGSTTQVTWTTHDDSNWKMAQMETAASSVSGNFQSARGFAKWLTVGISSDDFLTYNVVYYTSIDGNKWSQAKQVFESESQGGGLARLGSPIGTVAFGTERDPMTQKATGQMFVLSGVSGDVASVDSGGGIGIIGKLFDLCSCIRFTGGIWLAGGNLGTQPIAYWSEDGSKWNVAKIPVADTGNGEAAITGFCYDTKARRFLACGFYSTTAFITIYGSATYFSFPFLGSEPLPPPYGFIPGDGSHPAIIVIGSILIPSVIPIIQKQVFSQTNTYFPIFGFVLSSTDGKTWRQVPLGLAIGQFGNSALPSGIAVSKFGPDQQHNAVVCSGQYTTNNGPGAQFPQLNPVMYSLDGGHSWVLPLEYLVATTSNDNGQWPQMSSGLDVTYKDGSFWVTGETRYSTGLSSQASFPAVITSDDGKNWSAIKLPGPQDGVTKGLNH